MEFEILFIILFAVATTVALIARRFKIPYTVALVVAGLALGTTRAFPAAHLTKELLYALILPGLLFEAAFHLEFKNFLQNKLAIHSLAVPGVLAAMLLTAGLLVPVLGGLHFVEGFGFMHGLVFAALIAATDPIAVIGLFKSLGAPKRLAVLMEGESLLNDGTGVVVFTIVLDMVATGTTSAASALGSFVAVVGLGIVIGAGLGFAISKVIQQVDDPMIEITLTTIAAYGSFVLAEHFHASGVIATVTAGMLCGNYAARTGMSPTTRVSVETFWEYVAFALNSIVFLLIGFEVHLSDLAASWKPILAAYAAVTLGRAAVIFLVSALLRPTRERLPWSWSAVLTWGGMRGALSMVLVLGLPAEFAHRHLLVTMTFGVVLLSILFQGLTMAPLLRRLGLAGLRSGREGYEAAWGRMRAAAAVLGELDAMAREHAVPAEVVADLRAEYGERARAAEQELKAYHSAGSDLRHEEELAARRHLLLVEKDRIIEALHGGHVGPDAFEHLLRDVDARLMELDEGAESRLAATATAAERRPEAGAGRRGSDPDPE